ncbi:MAG: GNAT family N-acetyltransferase [Planctomycetes bacterium]|nr:GNAT family N-acetyltransferase [Planctomycetota bacterium]
MYERLGSMKLKTGEEVELGMITGPDMEWSEKLKPFLAHKGEPWNSQVEATSEKDLRPLETRHFVLTSDPETVYANVCTWTSGSVANLGHVYTAPEHRRKGAANILMKAAVERFVEGGGEAMYLETGYDTPPFHIYETWGFRGVFAGTGFMEYYSAGREEFLGRHFAAQGSRVTGLDWYHWPLTIALMGQEEGGVIRLPGEAANGRTNYESRFVQLQHSKEPTGKRAYVLEGASTGCAGGIAITGPDRRLCEGVKMLDIFVHPNFARALPELAARATEDVGEKIVAYVDSAGKARLEGLGAAGFKEEGRVKGVVVSPAGLGDAGARHDFIIMTRG